MGEEEEGGKEGVNEREGREEERNNLCSPGKIFFKKGIKLIYNAKGTGGKQGHSKL